MMLCRAALLSRRTVPVWPAERMIWNLALLIHSWTAGVSFWHVYIGKSPKIESLQCNLDPAPWGRQAWYCAGKTESSAKNSNLENLHKQNFLDKFVQINQEKYIAVITHVRTPDSMGI